MEGTTPLNGRKVLIIEDDPLIHHLLSAKLDQLRSHGVELHSVMNAEQGLEKAREVKPDLVLLDLLLPHMDGFEFLEKMRSEPELSKTPTVVLSNLSGENDKQRAKQLGVIAYFVKADFSLNQIADAIEEILQGKEVTKHEIDTPTISRTSKGYMIYL